MDIAMIAAEVAAAVGLAEGESGVRDILLAVARSEPVATNQIGRMAELPVPIVTAVCNELRKRGVIDKTRPVRLTATARAALAADGRHLDPQCPCCGGLGLRIPDELRALSDALEADAAGAPQARMELDQTHCTVPTKIRRVLKLHQAGALAGRSIALLGDDDLIAIAIARFASMLGIATGRLTVIDTDPAVPAGSPRRSRAPASMSNWSSLTFARRCLVRWRAPSMSPAPTPRTRCRALSCSSPVPCPHWRGGQVSTCSSASARGGQPSHSPPSG